MKVVYDIPFVQGDAPFFLNLSEVFIRPKMCLEQSIKYLSDVFPDGVMYRASLRGDITEMVKTLQDELSFPVDKSHSLDAFGDFLCNLSWLNSSHIILVTEMLNPPDNMDNYMILDTFLWAINMLNLERRMKLSILVLV